MAIPNKYSEGTVVVTNGSKVVAGTGTSWTSVAKSGGILQIVGSAYIGIVDTVDSDTQVTLVNNWDGATTSGSDDYTIVSYRDGGDILESTLTLFNRLASSGVVATTTGIPSPSTGSDGDVRYDPATDLAYQKVAGSWGVVGLGLFKRLLADDARSDTNAVQNWFSTGLATVEPDMTYDMSGFLHLDRSAGTDSHEFRLRMSGTATVAAIRGAVFCNAGDTDNREDLKASLIDGTTLVVVKGASTSATEQILCWIAGTVRIASEGGGTFGPQFSYSTAPGGAPTAKANSYFHLRPLGPADIVTNGDFL